MPGRSEPCAEILSFVLRRSAASYAVLGGRGGDRLGDRIDDARIEDARYDVLCAEFAFPDDIRDRESRRQFHVVGDAPRADVERAPENARKSQQIVDLVGKIRAPGRDDGRDGCSNVGTLLHPSRPSSRPGARIFPTRSTICWLFRAFSGARSTSARGASPTT